MALSARLTMQLMKSSRPHARDGRNRDEFLNTLLMIRRHSYLFNEKKKLNNEFYN